jgi:hypothetical protein
MLALEAEGSNYHFLEGLAALCTTANEWLDFRNGTIVLQNDFEPRSEENFSQIKAE